MTKAEEFKREAQVAAHEKHPRRKRREPAAKLAAQRGRAKRRAPNPTSHNEAPTRAKSASYELEVTRTTRPSRKSTRKSLNRQKTDSALRITQTSKSVSASARAARPRGH
jgi:hypothetical protein